MIELKARYSHKEGEKVLDEIGAELVEETGQEQLYLKSDGHDIYKLVKVGDKISFSHLTKEGQSFSIALSAVLQEPTTGSLVALFEESSDVLKLNRRCYLWEGSKIVLDEISNLGEFIEIYPKNNKTEVEVLRAFGVEKKDLIGDSYYDLLQEKRHFGLGR